MGRSGRMVPLLLTAVVAAALLFHEADGTNHTVGGTSGWELVSDLSSWSSGVTFYPGDNLVFVYSPAHSVLEVDELAFRNCDLGHPIASYTGSPTVVPLGKSGTRYFTCGTSSHCGRGLKLQVNVAADDPNRRGPGRPGPQPRPSPPARSSPPPPPQSDKPAPEVPDVPESPSPACKNASAAVSMIPGRGYVPLVSLVAMAAWVDLVAVVGGV